MELLGLHACAVRICLELYLRTSHEVDNRRVWKFMVASISVCWCVLLNAANEECVEKKIISYFGLARKFISTLNFNQSG